jgi:TrmH family RNA methyltransferase
VTQVKSVTSRDNPLLLKLRKLANDPGAYRKLGEVWIEGDHLCSAFVQKGEAPPLAVITETGWDDPHLRRLASAAAATVMVPPALMADISGLESPAPIGFVIAWAASTDLRVDEGSVVLDRLQDAGNVGAVLRSAAAFGFRQVIAIKGTAALWSPKVLRAGMGSHFGLHLVEGVDESVLDNLTLPLLATSSHAEHAIHEVTLPWPCAWVMGHEGQGVSHGLLQRCAMSLRIPQPGGEESLNVAMAAAVCLYESARQQSTARIT